MCGGGGSTFQNPRHLAVTLLPSQPLLETWPALGLPFSASHWVESGAPKQEAVVIELNGRPVRRSENADRTSSSSLPGTGHTEISRDFSGIKSGSAYLTDCRSNEHSRPLLFDVLTSGRLCLGLLGVLFLFLCLSVLSVQGSLCSHLSLSMTAPPTLGNVISTRTPTHLHSAETPVLSSKLYLQPPLGSSAEL